MKSKIRTITDHMDFKFMITVVTVIVSISLSYGSMLSQLKTINTTIQSLERRIERIEGLLMGYQSSPIKIVGHSQISQKED